MSTRLEAWTGNGLTVVLLALLGAGIGAASSSRADRVWSLALSPDASLVAVMGDSGAGIYDPRRAERRFDVPHGRAAAFAPDGRTVAVATPTSIAIVDLERGERVHELATPGDYTTSIAMSPDGGHVASLGDSSNRLRLWNRATGALEWDVAAHDDAHYAIAISSDGALIATGGGAQGARSTQIRLWRSADGGLAQTIEIPRYAFVKEATFVDEGRALMVLFSDGEPNAVFDLSNIADIRSVPDHPLAALTGHVVLSSDGRYAAAPAAPRASWSLAVRIVDLTNGKTVLETDAMHGLWWEGAFLAEGRALAVAASDGTVTTWDLANGKRISAFAGNRPTRWPARWFVLAGAALAWFVAWTVVWARPQRSARGADWLLVPSVGFAAAVVIVVLHWIQVEDPWKQPDPISTLALLFLVEFVCLVGAGAVAGFTRSWRALTTVLVAFPALLVCTASVLLGAIASV